MANQEEPASRIRWGAAFLLAALLLSALGTLLFHLAFPAGVPLDPAAAAGALVGQATLAESSSWSWMAAAVAGTVAALFLSARRVATPGFPAAASWLAVACGMMLVAVVHAFRVTALPIMAAGQAQEPTLFESLLAAVLLLGALGQGLAYLGLMGVFWGESRSATPIVPTTLSAFAVLTCAVGAAGQLLALVPGGALTGAVLSFAWYPAVALMAPFALQLAWPHLDFAWTEPRFRATERDENPRATE